MQIKKRKQKYKQIRKKRKWRMKKDEEKRTN